MKVLVSGATGFVGSRLCGALVDGGHDVRRALHRHPSADSSSASPMDSAVVGGIAPGTDWIAALT